MVSSFPKKSCSCRYAQKNSGNVPYAEYNSRSLLAGANFARDISVSPPGVKKVKILPGENKGKPPKGVKGDIPKANS